MCAAGPMARNWSPTLWRSAVASAVREGRVCGVELADGTLVPANIVVSTSSLRTTVLHLVGREHFPERHLSVLANLADHFANGRVHHGAKGHLRVRPRNPPKKYFGNL